MRNLNLYNKHIEEDIIKWRLLCSFIDILNIIKNNHTIKSYLEINIFPKTISVAVFTESGKDPKINMKSQIVKEMLNKKKNIEGLIVSDFKAYYTNL